MHNISFVVYCFKNDVFNSGIYVLSVGLFSIPLNLILEVFRHFTSFLVSLSFSLSVCLSVYGIFTTNK